LLRQLLTAATLATGFGIVWAVFVALVGQAVSDALHLDRDWHSRDDIIIRSDGTPLIRSWTRDYQIQRYRDLDERPAETPRSNRMINGAYLVGAATRARRDTANLDWDNRLKVFVAGPEPGILWYFVHDGRKSGAGYFVGYGQLSKRRVGFLGQAGFRGQTPPVAERFPFRGSLMPVYMPWGPSETSLNSGGFYTRAAGGERLPPSWVYVPSGNRLVLVDLDERAVRTVFETPESIDSIGFPMPAVGTEERSWPSATLVVRTSSKVYALNRENSTVRVFDIPNDDRDEPLNWYELGEGQALAEFQRYGQNQEDWSINQHMLYWIAADGTIRRRVDVALHSGMSKRNPFQPDPRVSLALPAPLILLVLEAFFRQVGGDPLETYQDAVRAILKDTWPFLLSLTVVVLVLAVAAWRRARKFALSVREQVVWALFVFVFGLPGYAGFLLHRRWPTRANCPNCEARVPLDREHCAACGDHFPEPARTGIEIFA
jgi:hypothetical protein